jgi:ribonuclease P protein component
VRLKGKRVRTAHLEVRFIASLLRSALGARRVAPHPRAGVIVPKYSHNSVERNLVKRRLREIVRQDMLPLLSPVDVVVRALPSAYRASFADLRVQCRRAFERAGLVPIDASFRADAKGDAIGDAG